MVADVRELRRCGGGHDGASTGPVIRNENRVEALRRTPSKARAGVQFVGPSPERDSIGVAVHASTHPDRNAESSSASGVQFKSPAMQARRPPTPNDD
jgi:hypothetical protein